MAVAIDIDRGRVTAFCRRHHVTYLALFGSVLRTDFGPGSDVDVLVRFQAAHTPGLIRLGAMTDELAEILGHTEIDLRTPEDLSEYFRDEVLAEAQVLYEQA